MRQWRETARINQMKIRLQLTNNYMSHSPTLPIKTSKGIAYFIWLHVMSG